MIEFTISYLILYTIDLPSLSSYYPIILPYYLIILFYLTYSLYSEGVEGEIYRYTINKEINKEINKDYSNVCIKIYPLIPYTI